MEWTHKTVDLSEFYVDLTEFSCECERTVNTITCWFISLTVDLICHISFGYIWWALNGNRDRHRKCRAGIFNAWTLTGAWTSWSDKLNDRQLGWQNMQRLRDTLLGQIWYTYSLFVGSISSSEFVAIVLIWKQRNSNSLLERGQTDNIDYNK